ncbi:predicted protein [Naegleria gruberi]|uniref:Predicted protein n=1 Tax=Naegleria gruberi TaxID=5762 RepID=D2V2Z5_NAEGR|nr:uncharacterized protein NAEGRDRAFT_63170 [Naegleria gruberi]EFC48693.1 predicted protein [Naegleria gruberi]|eukprot:XP_002681437.1 predicted protein [Naegleria gruberi strain NEG-M]
MSGLQRNNRNNIVSTDDSSSSHKYLSASDSHHRNNMDTCNQQFELNVSDGTCALLGSDTLDGISTHILHSNIQNTSDILSSFISNFDVTSGSASNTCMQTTSTAFQPTCYDQQHPFFSIAKDLPANGMFALSSDKFKIIYPRLPLFIITIQNCNVLLKLLEENNQISLSCHIAAFKVDGKFDVITFNEGPLNQDMSFEELLQKHVTSPVREGGVINIEFHPRGSILPSDMELSMYSHFTINFQLICNCNSLIDQISLAPFKIPNVSISMKEDFSSSSKYIIGSLAGRSDSLIKKGTKKLPSPISVKLSKKLMDQCFNSGMKELYLNVYVRGEDGISCDSFMEHNHSDQYCLLKHSIFKLRPDIYTYSIDEELGKLEKGEKKPQKSKFRLGIALTTKFMVKNKDFSKKIIKFKTSNNGKSIVAWSETTQFSCATRQEICLKGSKRGRNELEGSDCASVVTSSIVDESPPPTPQSKIGWTCFNTTITPTSTTYSSFIHPTEAKKTNNEKSNLIQSLVEMRNEFSKYMEQQIYLQKEFEIKSQTLIDLLERSGAESPSQSIPVHFSGLVPNQGVEGTFVSQCHSVFCLMELSLLQVEE